MSSKSSQEAMVAQVTNSRTSSSRYMIRPGSRSSESSEKMLQKQRQTRSGRILIRTCDREVIHGRAPAESERLRNHAAPSMQNHRSRAVNLTSEPCEAAAGARNCAAFTLYQQCQGRRMQSEKEQVALSSIAASAVLTIAKTVVGVSTGSLAILSEAGHSLIDFGATVMTYAAVRISGKPADKEHHYGHGKVESVSALGETALLFLLSGVVIWEAVKRLTEHEEHMVIANAWAFGVIAVSIAVDFFRSRALSRTAKQ